MVPYVEQRCAPVVKAVLAYQRDHGPLYNDTALVPKYLPSTDDHPFVLDGRSPHQVVLVTDFHNERVRYQVDGPTQGWTIEGAFVNGVVPAPLLAQLSGPTTRSVSRR